MCMCMLNKRAQILLDKDMWEKLKRHAKRGKVSVSELVREAVKVVYSTNEEIEQRRQVYEAILKMRSRAKGKVNYKELINYGRKY